MKVAYVFSTSGHTASYKLGKMILPQLEQGTHGVEVVGLFFFDDNNYILRKGDPIGERLAKVAAEQRHPAHDVRSVRGGAGSRRGGTGNVSQPGESRRHRRWRASRLLSGPLHRAVWQHAGSGDHPLDSGSIR